MQSPDINKTFTLFQNKQKVHAYNQIFWYKFHIECKCITVFENMTARGIGHKHKAL